MRRRTFIATLGGAAVWPLVARAQQSDRVRRIGVLVTRTADDPDLLARVTVFLQRLQQLGWTAATCKLTLAGERAMRTTPSGQFVPGREGDDQIAMNHRQSARRHNQTAIRSACEGRDGAAIGWKADFIGSL